MVDFRSLHEHELENWFDHCTEVYKDSFGIDLRHELEDHWYNDPWKDINNILVAVDNGRIASTVRIFRRHVFIHGKKVSMGGLGEVSTRKEYEGKGFAGKLLLESINRMKEQGISISWLASALNGYYDRFGWVPAELNWKVCEASVNQTGTFNVRLFNFEKDIELIKKIYNDYSSRYNGTLVRDGNEYWNSWFRTEAGNCMVAENGKGEIIAYICLREIDNGIVIREFGALLLHENIFDIFLGQILFIIDRENCEIKYPDIIKSNFLIKRMEAKNHYMYRLINPFYINDACIDNTEKLIEVIIGKGCDDGGFKHLLWLTDAF